MTACGSAASQTGEKKEETSAPAEETTDTAEDTSETTDTSSAEGALVGFCALDTGNAFVAGLAEDTKTLLEAEGVEVQIADAALDSSKQISQIENFAVMGAKAIIVIPVDPDSLTDSIKYAQEQGAQVLVMNGDTGAYDCFMTSDRYEIGKTAAQLTANWIEETFPDAADESVEVAIFESRTNPQESNNSDGMHEITNLCSKAKVVKVVDGIATNQAAQEAVSTVLQTNPDIKAIICFNGEGCLGVSEYAMASSSIDKSQFATFGADWSDQIAEEVHKSLTNESLYRGSVKFGSDNIAQSSYEIVMKMLTGQPYEKVQLDPIVAVDKTNIADYYTAQ
jgi:ABC-type sugar transport system substrate-binding protein